MGDHFEVDKALADVGYVRSLRGLLEPYELDVWAIGGHLVGQAVCDRIDGRHRAILPPDVYGDGDPEGVRQRAAERMKDTAPAAARLGITQVNGFTGSSIWHMLYSIPPNDFAEIARGYEDFAERWNPIRDVFDKEGVHFRARGSPDGNRVRLRHDATRPYRSRHRTAFGVNLDPSHFARQSMDAAQFALEFGNRIYHVHVKDSKKRLDGRRSILGSHLNFGDEARGWDFVTPGRGDVDFEVFFGALNRIGYQGPLSIESEDSGMDRDSGAPRTRSRSSAAPTSRHRRSPSTRRCR